VSALTLIEEAKTVRASWLGACELAYPKVYRALIAMGASPEDAADALQDAFERAMKVRADVSSPDGWLFVVALNRWRRERWRTRIFHPLTALLGRTGGQTRDAEIDLFSELGKLTGRQRTVLVARHALGLSQKEIGEILGISPGTVGAIAYQATRTLRNRLER
jgi:RNA polymerase sigma factor (sigma-70 family)